MGEVALLEAAVGRTVLALLPCTVAVVAMVVPLATCRVEGTLTNRSASHARVNNYPDYRGGYRGRGRGGYQPY